MPTISYFFGIYIMMYFDEHFPPHFHAKYQGFKGSIHIQTGELIDGKLPKQALRLIEEWRRIHESELMKAWDDARHFKHPGKIAPLED